jgi:hypothetical protein
MRDFAQGLIDGLDKTTKAGFSEALLIAISDLKNKDGLHIRLTLGNDFEEHIEYVKQIAEMMIKDKNTRGQEK